MHETLGGNSIHLCGEHYSCPMEPEALIFYPKHVYLTWKEFFNVWTEVGDFLCPITTVVEGDVAVAGGIIPRLEQRNVFC